MTRPEGGRSAALPLTLWASVLVAVTADVVLGGPLTRLDHAIVDWLIVHWDVHVRHHGRWSTPELIMTPLAEFGGRTSVVLVVLPFVAYLSVRHRTIRPLARLAVTTLLVVGVVVGLKIVFGRVSIPDGAMWSGGRTFPSGHTATAAVMWGLAAQLAVDYRSRAWVRAVTRVLAVVAPLATATSMVLMRWHWLTDVLAGAAIGVLLLAVVREVDRRVLAHWPGASRGITGAGVPAADPLGGAGGSDAGVGAAGVGLGGGGTGGTSGVGAVGGGGLGGAGVGGVGAVGVGGERGALHDPRPADT